MGFMQDAMQKVDSLPGLNNKYINPVGHYVEKNIFKNKPAPKPAATPKPSTDTTPPTLDDALNSTQLDTSPKKATANGTIGDMGPEGLIAPAKTANLTLLGGTK